MIVALYGRNLGMNLEVANLIQYLNSPYFNLPFQKFNLLPKGERITHSGWQIRQFNEGLKPFISNSLNDKVELDSSQILENPWSSYRIMKNVYGADYCVTTFYDLESATDFVTTMGPSYTIVQGSLTVKEFASLLDVQIRTVIPTFWVNFLMARYKPVNAGFSQFIRNNGVTISKENFNPFDLTHAQIVLGKEIKDAEFIYPKWIIANVSTLKEAAVIKERGGLIIGLDWVANRKSVADYFKITPDCTITTKGNRQSIIQQLKSITDQYSRKIIE